MVLAILMLIVRMRFGRRHFHRLTPGHYGTGRPIRTGQQGDQEQVSTE